MYNYIFFYVGENYIKSIGLRLNFLFNMKLIDKGCPFLRLEDVRIFIVSPIVVVMN